MKTSSISTLASRQVFTRLLLALLFSLSSFASLAAAPAADPTPVPGAPRQPVASYQLFAPLALRNGFQAAVQPPANQEARFIPRTALPDSTCAVSGGVFSCDLYARAGSLALPGLASPLPVWGYTAVPSGTVTNPGGPTLIVTQGSDLAITLHNVDIPSATSFAITQLSGVPDTQGVTAGNSKTYAIPAASLAPGTYLYEAGLTADGPRQAAMGLFGALIVRPSACAACVYGAGSSFTDEGVFVLSEVDPAFNASPLAFNMAEYNPSYFLINGKPYPDVDTPDPLLGIAASTEAHVALRFANAGLVHHSMTVLGLRQQVIARDGKEMTHPYTITAETIPTGETLDSLVTVISATLAGTRFPIFDAAMRLYNNGALDAPGNANPSLTPVTFGGMLTMMTVAGQAGSNGGPVVQNLSAAPNPTNGSVPLTLDGGAVAVSGVVQAAEYFVDSLGSDGSGTAISAAFGSGTVSLSFTVDPSTLLSGSRTFFVHAQDSNGTWGPPAAVVLNLDQNGPVIDTQALSPNPTNGQSDLDLQATARDTNTGGSKVIAAEYFIDPSGNPAPGSGISITLDLTDTIVSLRTTLPASVVSALAEGSHAIAIRAEDALGNWGPFTHVTLSLDKTGPQASPVTTRPNPTNGTIGLQSGTLGSYFQLLNASLSDPQSGGLSSNITAAEYFVDSTGANGTGGAMTPVDGAFNSSSEAAQAAIPLYAITALAEGPHTFYVHGRDAAGNWGDMGAVVLKVDKTGLVGTINSLSPNPTLGVASAALNVSFTDPLAAGLSSNVTNAEWFLGPDLGKGAGTAIPVTTPAGTVTLNAPVSLSGLANNSYLFQVRGKDEAANWGLPASRILDILPASGLFADGFETGGLGRWSASTGAGLSVTNAGLMAANNMNIFALTADLGSGSSYVTYNTPTSPTVNAYRARFYYNPNGVTSAHNIFTALNGATTVFQVQYRRLIVPQVRLVVTRSGGTSATNWYTINANTNSIEVSWRSSPNTAITLITNGAVRQTISNLTTVTSANHITAVRLGAQNVPGGGAGVEYFDSFVSTRTSAIGQ
jgi:hypothetical protein